MASREERILRGVTNDDLKQVIRKALQLGWEMGPISGSTHGYLQWPPTKEKVGFGTTWSDRNAYKGFARQLETISGVEILPKHRHGRAKQKQVERGYSNTRPTKEQRESQEQWTRRIRSMHEEYRDLSIEFHIIASPGETKRGDINRAAMIIRRMIALENFFEELNQPIPETPVPLPRLRDDIPTIERSPQSA